MSLHVPSCMFAFHCISVHSPVGLEPRPTHLFLHTDPEKPSPLHDCHPLPSASPTPHPPPAPGRARNRGSHPPRPPQGLRGSSARCSHLTPLSAAPPPPLPVSGQSQSDWGSWTAGGQWRCRRGKMGKDNEEATGFSHISLAFSVT